MKTWKTGSLAIALVGLLSILPGSGAIAGENAVKAKGVFMTADIVVPTNRANAPPAGLVKFADLRPETKYTVETVQYVLPRRYYGYYSPYRYSYSPYYTSYPYYTYRPY